MKAQHPTIAGTMPAPLGTSKRLGWKVLSLWEGNNFQDVPVVVSLGNMGERVFQKVYGAFRR
jgi:hypothetical protein